MIVEVNEAILAGHDVINQANKVLSYLDSAKLWGFFDLFSDRSLLSGIVKHSKIEDADYAMNDLRNMINRFNRELNDVKVYEEVANVDIDGFIKFLDIFCDGFFVDIYALSKIKDAKSRIESLISEVNQILNSLQDIK